MSSLEKIPSFTIKQLFESKNVYVIPIYQRNYAWELGEITQLLQDVYDYSIAENKKDRPYYIGTLVVYERNINNNIVFETIDGQQRLTTLTILLNALHRWCFSELKNKIELNLELKFFSRPKSTLALNVISTGLDRNVNFINTQEYNTNIKERYLDAENLLKQFFGKPEKALDFYQYLTQKVTLLRVSVPEKTDLNHYFEVMNNRGEQLEKHEVLKAQLLSYFVNEPEKLEVYNTIWEAVSDLERYVQYGFSTILRDKLFGKGEKNQEYWNHLQCVDFESCVEIIKNSAKPSSSSEKYSPSKIEDIVDFPDDFTKNTNQIEDAPERFNSVVNFSTFLLHILRIQTQEDIPLDDKRLIDTFKSNLKTKKDVEEFGFNLLKGKHLFDQFILKREFTGAGDNWSLKKLKRYPDNKIGYVNTLQEPETNDDHKNLLMLLSMFHVSLPAMNYKHWLSASLNYLFSIKESNINVNKYSEYLFEIAKSYFYDRILTPDGKQELDYYLMIFKDYYKNRIIDINELEWSNLDQGTGVENFAFNFLDYLLWKEKNTDFDFTFRSSVEHYYPQNPINGIKLNDLNILNSFGNLCLISNSKNSKLSNYMPIAKKDHYASQKKPDSLKQEIMMHNTTDNSPWDEKAILDHRKEMINVLTKYYSI